MSLYTYLSTASDFSDIDAKINAANKEELNASEEASNCALALIANENIPNDNVRFTILRKLIEKGLDLSRVDPQANVLVYASIRDDPEVIKYLLEHGADVSKQGYRAIREACWHQRPLNLQLLLEKASPALIGEELADPTIEQDEFGFTIIHAALYGFLREAGLIAASQTEQRNVDPRTIVENFNQIMNVLLEKITNTQSATNMLWILLNTLSEMKQRTDAKDYEIEPDIDVAVIERVLKIFSEKLCEAGADPYVVPKTDSDELISSAADMAKTCSMDDMLHLFDRIATDNFTAAGSLKEMAARALKNKNVTDDQLKSRGAITDTISYMRKLRASLISPEHARKVHENMLRHQSERKKAPTKRPT